APGDAWALADDRAPQTLDDPPGEPSAGARILRPFDGLTAGAAHSVGPPQDEPVSNGDDEEADSDAEAPVVAGALRSPRHWEKLLVDAAVIGGRDRWKRRLDALERELVLQRSAPDLSEAKAAQLDRTLADLVAFRGYALPLLDVLAPLSDLKATWGRWCTELSALATRALR